MWVPSNEVETLMIGFGVLTKETTKSQLMLPLDETQTKPSMNKVAGFHQTPNLSMPSSALPSFQNYEQH